MEDIESDALLGSDIIFRPIQLADIPEIHLFPVTYGDSFYKRLLKPGFFTVAAISKGQVIGVATARYEQRSYFDKALSYVIQRNRHSYLCTLGVRQDFRRKGIGSALLQEICRVVAKRGRCHSIALHVKTENRAAVDFYEKHGFIRLCREYQFYEIRNQLWDAFHLIKYLDDINRPHMSPLSLMLSSFFIMIITIWSTLTFVPRRLYSRVQYLLEEELPT
ncbi:GCN5-related N-acetyltransferase [Planoprotostelium fungivorum]|uniref:N-alpha-acetyltransferase 60 n=1 Tax=Planoprotostelium fungivorum TaxID=1890364 RepID=A0A2P6NTS9_9EUKA|nr:GCN5-related N-acetyltransferase [Planoprotostelium fungivorum]